MKNKQKSWNKEKKIQRRKNYSRGIQEFNWRQKDCNREKSVWRSANSGSENFSCGNYVQGTGNLFKKFLLYQNITKNFYSVLNIEYGADEEKIHINLYIQKRNQKSYINKFWI